MDYTTIDELEEMYEVNGYEFNEEELLELDDEVRMLCE